MPSAWNTDDDDIPDDLRARKRRRRLRIAGLALWGLFAGSVTVLLVSDTNDLTTLEIVSLIALSLGTAIVAVGTGALLFLILRQFAVLGQMVVGLLFLILFFVVLPPLVSLVIENVSLFEGVSAESDQPLLDLIDTFVG